MVVKGKKLTQKDYYNKLKEELRSMETPRDKLEHLWEYYKWIPAVFLGFVAIISMIIAAIISLNTQTILAGAIINVPVSPEGYSMLQDGYYERAHTEGKRQIVELTNMNFVEPFSTVEQTYSMDIMENVTAMIGADLLDYVIYDEVALPYFMTPELFADLRWLFSEEELAAMGNAVIKLEMEDGTLIPIAIEIGDTAFYKNYMELERKLFLSFSIRLPRKEASLDFWQFLKGGETQLLNTVIAGTVTDAQLTEKGEAAFSTNFFRAQGCVAGDHRVELTKQSFLPAPDYEGEDPSPKIKANVLKTLKNGTLDYIVFDESALDTLVLADLLTLTEVGQLPETGILYDGDCPVAVELAALGFEGAEGKAYIAFSASTKRLDICRELWKHISE